MNEMFYGGETVHHKKIFLVKAFHLENIFSFWRGGGIYAS